MIPYQEYMRHPNELYEAYYDQFVTEEVIKLVRSRFSVNTLRSAGDSFNGIGLRQWDLLSFSIDTPEMKKMVKAVGGWWSLADRVCTLKAAARRIVGEQNNVL